MLSELLSKLRPSQRSVDSTASFKDIPQLPGGATLITPVDASPDLKGYLRDLFHGLFQSSATGNPASVFIIGVPDNEVLRRYPNAKALRPHESVSRVDITPSSAMGLLRALYGTGPLSEHIWTLFYLECAGNEIAKAGPLAMIPSWVEQQLSLETIAAVLTGMQRDDATVGAMVRALSQSNNFEFQLLDWIRHDTTIDQGGCKLSASTKKALNRWRQHALAVVKALRETIDNPPISLKLIPALREAQQGQYGVYYIPEEFWVDVAPILDVLVLSRGTQSSRHWLIDIAQLGAEYPEGFNAATRLGAHLWQARGTSDVGHNVWWMLDSEIMPVQPKQYDHRCAQGSTFLIGPMEAVEVSAINAFAPSFQHEVRYVGIHDFGVFRTADFRFKTFTPTEIAASVQAVLELHDEESEVHDKNNDN